MSVISKREDVKSITPNIYFMSDENVGNPVQFNIIDNTDVSLSAIDKYALNSNITRVVPNDPAIPENYWVFQNTQLYEAWGTYTTGNSDVKVGIIDDGVKAVSDVSPNLITGYNFNNDSTVTGAYKSQHGTCVAGVVGAKGNNGIGVSGVNWDVSMVPLQISSQNQDVHFELAIKALTYANQNNVPIVNMSCTANYNASNAGISFTDAVYNYYGLLVCSAGNSGKNTDNSVLLPSTCEAKNVISVAAVDQNDNLYSWSNYGSKVDIAAPGTVITPNLDGTFSEHSGTSMASPFVAGVAALLLAYKPDLTTMQLKEAILNSVDVKASLNGKVSTSGRINAYKALKYVDESDYRQIVCQVSSGNSSINEFKDYITYDSDIVAYKGFKTWNSLLANHLSVSFESRVNSTNAGLLSVNYRGNSLSANQKKYTLKFEMNMTAYNNVSNPISELEFYTFVSSGGNAYWAMLGDVNNDGKINNTDLTYISNYVSGSYNSSNTQKVAMDVNMDGVINIYDIITLQNYINGTIHSF